MLESCIGLEQHFGCIMRATTRFQDALVVFFPPGEASEVLLKAAAERIGLKQLKNIMHLVVFHRFFVSDFDNQSVSDEIAATSGQDRECFVCNVSESDNARGQNELRFLALYVVVCGSVCSGGGGS